MDRYVSTYSKDYTWPYPERQETRTKDETFRVGPCTCGMDPRDIEVPRKYRSDGEALDWSRVGPMGPLLDPKLFPAKTGPSPETEETRFGQPDVYLKKLKEKYPYLYGAMQSGPSPETTLQVEEDRMMTTYMMDYGGGRQFDKPTLESEDRVSDHPLNGVMKRDCRPHTRPPLSKFRSSALDRNGKNGNGRKKRGRRSDDADGPEVRIAPWKSEYQDSISKEETVRGIFFDKIFRNNEHKRYDNMNILSSNRLRSSSATNKSAKTSDNTRKGSLRASSTLDTGWSKDTRTNPLRSTASSIYQVNACLSSHDLRRPEEKTSEETILVEVDGNVDDYLGTATKQKTDALLRRDYRYLSDYPDMNVSQAMLAMQKLQRLKELQKRRDLTERYYSYEIRKLIGDYFDSNPRLNVSPIRYTNEKMKNPSVFQPYFGNRSNDVVKSLEPCGTMTTITRLDCGCIQETTRPIFTTARGRVQKKTCNQSQDQVFLKLTSSNPQEHLCSTMESKTEQYEQKLRKNRVALDGKLHGKNCMNVDRELATVEHDHRGTHNKQETYGKSPGNVSTSRKCSDTSVTSV